MAMKNPATPDTPPASRDLVDAVGRSLDREAGEPLYQQVAGALRRGIDAGELQDGTALPTQRELAARWGIGEVTVRRALQQLGGQGYLRARPGRGTIVTRPTPTPGPGPNPGGVLTPGGARRAGDRAHDGGADQPFTVGIAFADLVAGYPFMRPLLAGMHAAMPGGQVHLFDMPEADVRTGSLEHAPALDTLDGLVMMSPVNLQLVAACQHRGLPVVLLYSDIADGHSRCIVVDYAHGLHQAVGHLLAAGRRNPAMVTAGAARFSTGQLVDAFGSALEIAGLEPRSDRIIHAGYQESDGYRATRDLLRRPDPPDAILFAEDHQARGGLLAARELGVTVPDSLSIIGAGRTLEDDGWPTRLASIDLHMGHIGRLVVELLHKPLAKAADAGTDYRVSVPAVFTPGDTA